MKTAVKKVVACMIFLIALLAVSFISRQSGTAAVENEPAASKPSGTESGLLLLTVKEPGYDVTVKEVEREDRYSVLEMKGVVPTTTAGGVILFRAIYDIAKERGIEYMFSLPPLEGNTTRGPEGRQVFTVVKVFMTKDEKTSLKELRGDDYSEVAQEMFDRQGYISVSLLATLYGGLDK